MRIGIIGYFCLCQTVLVLVKSTIKNITVESLLNLIPDKLLEDLSAVTNVDHQVKKLFGKNMFYLLLYGFLDNTRISLRGLEDIYNSQKFKFLFNIDQQNTIKYNSLSDRLTALNPDFLKKVYEYVYGKFSEVFNSSEAEKYSIIRVDSTLVKEVANKLQRGITMGNQHNKAKHVKFTVATGDIFPSMVEVFTSQETINENKTIPQVIINHKNKSGIFVFDRGVNKRDIFDDFDEKEIQFVTRINPTKHIKVLSSSNLKVDKYDNLVILSDEKVRLYSRKKKLSKPFRLIKTVRNESQEEIFFLTNCDELETTEVISIYRKRWDIEVFFRFIKQELNFSHFVSTSTNGIKNVLYITLILSMLILVYKKANEIGYKTAVRRFGIELDELITKMMITFAGGDPNLVFR